MAVAVRSITSIAFGSRTNTTLTAPAGLTDNDILLAIVVAGDAGDEVAPTVTGPAGFVEAVNSPVQISAPDPYAVGLHVFWKLASSEAGDYTFTHSAASSEGVLYAISGAYAIPLNPYIRTLVGEYPHDVVYAAGLDTPNDESLVIYAALTWNFIGPASPPAGTTPTFTERYDPEGAGVLYVADGVMATAGPTGYKSVTTANPAADPCCAALISVQAATGPLTVIQFTFGAMF